MTQAGVYRPMDLFAQVPHCSREQERHGLGRKPVPPPPLPQLFFGKARGETCFSGLCKDEGPHHLSTRNVAAQLAGIVGDSLCRDVVASHVRSCPIRERKSNWATTTSSSEAPPSKVPGTLTFLVTYP